MTDTSIPDLQPVAVPLHVEEIGIERRVVKTGIVQVNVRSTSNEHRVDELLTDEHVEIERVPLNQVVDSVPPVREDGDTTVISVCEEIVVVERRLVLKEEIRLRRVRTTRRHQESVTVREQDATIERLSPGNGVSPSAEQVASDANPSDKDRNHD